MKFKTTLKTTPNLIDLTSLVDVVFLLLIFFIVTSDILPLKSLNIENPSLDRSSTPMTTQLPVILDAQNVIYVGSKKSIIDFASLKSFLQNEIEKLQQQHQDFTPTVVLSVDRRVSYDDFLRIFSVVQECTSKIRLAYQKNEENLF